MRPEPAWAVELLDSWSRADWRDTETQLGMPSVSGPFRGMLEISTEIDVTGYSSAEVQAVAAAVEYLNQHHVDHYRAISLHFRPWSKSQLSVDARLLTEAVAMVAEFVDKALG